MRGGVNPKIGGSSIQPRMVTSAGPKQLASSGTMSTYWSTENGCVEGQITGVGSPAVGAGWVATGAVVGRIIGDGDGASVACAVATAAMVGAVVVDAIGAPHATATNAIASHALNRIIRCHLPPADE